MLNLNLPPMLEKLDELRDQRDEEITYLYQKLFSTEDGKMVLVDLMDLFFEFKPTTTEHEAGSQAVIIYIKNRVIGVSQKKNQSIGPTGGDES